jgi:hypothetical protein
LGPFGFTPGYLSTCNISRQVGIVDKIGGSVWLRNKGRRNRRPPNAAWSENNASPRPQAGRSTRQFRTIHAGHADIRKQDGHVLVSTKDLQRIDTIGGN